MTRKSITGFSLRIRPVISGDPGISPALSPTNRHQRKETRSEAAPDGCRRKFSCDEIIAGDKTSLDIAWLKDESLADLDILPDPDLLAEKIVENLERALEGFRVVLAK